MDIKYRNALKNVQEKLTELNITKSIKEKTLDKETKELDEISKKYSDLNQSKEVLNKASEICRLKAISVMENTVNPMLQAIAGPNYSFRIEHTILRGKPAINFWIVSNVDGEESLQDPINFCGGGFVDCISTALRFAFVSLYDGGINNAIVADEPGRMVSQEASGEFADFIKYFGKTFNKQIIMCTHNPMIATYADRTIEVSKDIDTSKITII